MLKRFLSPKPAVCTGLDITPSHIKLLALTSNAHNFIIEDYISVKLPGGALVGDKIKNPEQIASAIQLALQGLQTKVKEVAIALPDTLVISKTVSMEATLTEEEIEAQIALEANKYLAYPINEVYLDFTVIGPSKLNNQCNDVLIVATHTQTVEEYLQLAKQCNLTIKIIEVESYTLAFSLNYLALQLPENWVNKQIAIINLDAARFSFFVINRNRPVFSYNEFFHPLPKILDNNLKFAEQFFSHDFNIHNNQREDLNTTDAWQNYLIPLLQRIWDLFLTTTQLEFVDLILLTGAMTTTDLKDLINKKFKVPTKIINPIENILMSSKVDKRQILDDAKGLLLCYALALRSLANAGN